MINLYVLHFYLTMCDIFRVRDIFLANPIRKAKINFHEMIKRPSMIVSYKHYIYSIMHTLLWCLLKHSNNYCIQDAVQAVLDALVEQISSAESANFDCYKVYYSILDSNQYGETPDKTKKNHSTLLDVIALIDNKVTAWP